MMKFLPPEVTQDRYISVLGILFYKINYTSRSARAISMLYKGIYILFHILIIKYGKRYKYIRNSNKIRSIVNTLHAAHRYGYPISDKNAQIWIDTICLKHKISDSEKIILGFSGVFKPKRKKVFISGLAWFEKTIFISLASFLSINFILVTIYLTLILISQDITASKVVSIVTFLPTYAIICFNYILIMKGSHWDSHHLIKKYALSSY